ncbi:fluoride efflux transporter CrcB [Rhizobium daejeonense]|uniref:Fluoride-specific ion channel FluC n=1 Tax=Rhizobium daejeonense TaxID=240521 RepID=A0A6M1S8P9_9HYPH|nr:fluoride efflux transporter CrcB [Rhizobium daejeonense]NGO63056.1 fluoride efflux transporter CrcB [Rhizobium daejeonense]
MMQIVLVATGGAVGSVLRYVVGLGAMKLLGSSFPWGTLTVNVVGCFGIGVLAELIVARFGGSADLRLLLITGFLGGFTTFSAFALDAVSLFERGAAFSSFVYLASSIVVSIAATVAGMLLMRSVL